MNSVNIVGNLASDPVIKNANGNDVCNFTIAVQRSYTNKDGVREADFFNCGAFGKVAKSCEKYLEKGKKVSITGALQNNTFENKDGKKETRTMIVVNLIEFLTPVEAKKNNTNDVEIPF